MTMKYIRTIDGIYRNASIPTNLVIICRNRKCEVNPSDILKRANTIEELCDEFRGVWINYYESEKKDAHEEYHYDKEKNVFYNDFEELTPKETIEKFDIFYGGIWTYKGLIYKAKMKDILSNGEIVWELL